LCEEGAKNEREGGVERGFVAAIARELRMIVAPKIYQCNSYPYETSGVVPGCQQVFDTNVGQIQLTLDGKCGL